MIREGRPGGRGARTGKHSGGPVVGNLFAGRIIRFAGRFRLLAARSSAWAVFDHCRARVRVCVWGESSDARPVMY